MQTEPIVIERHIAAPPAIVYTYFTTEEKWPLWQGTDATLDPKPGGIFAVLMPNGMRARGQFIELTPARRVVFTWGWIDHPGVPPGSSTVEINLTADGAGTLVTLRHTGLPADEVEPHTEGWNLHLPNLAVVAAGEADAPDGEPAAAGISTADLSDANPDAAVAMAGMADFGGRLRFAGPIRTVRCFEDNSLVRAALEEPGGGAVLVVDGGASLGCALLGDRLGELAITNGWTGVLVNGCVRDTADLAQMALGVRALAPSPRKSIKRGAGERDVPVSFLGVDFAPGAWVYADEDGVVVLPEAAGG